MRINTAAFVFVIGFILFSCRKGDSPVVNNTALLSGWHLHMALPNGFITQVDTLFRDNQNRLVKITDHYTDDAPDDDWQRRFIFTYHGTDSLPYLMNAPSAYSSYDKQVVCDYLLYYDNLGRIIKDSTSEGTVTTFSYNMTVPVAMS
jgi:hypothetical protein